MVNKNEFNKLFKEKLTNTLTNFDINNICCEINLNFFSLNNKYFILESVFRTSLITKFVDFFFLVDNYYRLFKKLNK